MTNTGSLNSNTPDLTLVNDVIDTETYGQPPAAEQKPGPTPLLDLTRVACGYKNHEELVEDNDDRLQNVTFASGMLWTSVPTVVKTPQGPIAGEDFFPSAGYVTLDATNGTGPIVISFSGVAPDDGFSAYRPLGPDFRVGRWGDFAWATSDENEPSGWAPR